MNTFCHRNSEKVLCVPASRRHELRRDLNLLVWASGIVLPDLTRQQTAGLEPSPPMTAKHLSDIVGICLQYKKVAALHPSEQSFHLIPPMVRTWEQVRHFFFNAPGTFNGYGWPHRVYRRVVTFMHRLYGPDATGQPRIPNSVKVGDAFDLAKTLGLHVVIFINEWNRLIQTRTLLEFTSGYSNRASALVRKPRPRNAGDTVTVGDETFTFVASPVAEGEVKIGTTDGTGTRQPRRARHVMDPALWTNL